MSSSSVEASNAMNRGKRKRGEDFFSLRSRTLLERDKTLVSCEATMPSGTIEVDQKYTNPALELSIAMFS